LLATILLVLLGVGVGTVFLRMNPHGPDEDNPGVEATDGQEEDQSLPAAKDDSPKAKGFEPAGANGQGAESKPSVTKDDSPETDDSDSEADF
jgi:hypothetical protein